MPKPAAKKKPALDAKRGGMTGFVERAKPRSAPTPTAKRTPPAKRPARPAKAATAPAAVRAVRGRPKVIFDERRQLITRLTLEQYHRVRQLALDAGTTAQELVLAGLSREFVERGLEPL